MKRADLQISSRELPLPPALPPPADAGGVRPAASTAPVPAWPDADARGVAVADARAARPATQWAQLPPVWFALAVAAMLVLHHAAPLFHWNLGTSRWWGLPFVAAGVALVLGGVRRFSSRTTLHPFREPSLLVTTGAFAWSRNPMYTGLVLSLVGAAVMLGSLSAALCVPPFVLLLRLRFVAHEERALEARFGEAYRRYHARVRRWL